MFLLSDKGEYTLERYRRRFCNQPKMLECEQNFGRISEGKTISELIEPCSNFCPIFKAIANQRTEKKITSESNIHYQSHVSGKMAAPESVKSKDIFKKICVHLEFYPAI